MIQHLLLQTEHPKSGSGTGHRASVRFPGGRARCCYAEDANTDRCGRIRDVSLGGIAFVLPQRLEPGMDLVVRFITQAHGSWYRLVHVVHATEQRKDRWIIGCAFARPLSEGELRVLLEDRALPDHTLRLRLLAAS